MKIFCQIFLPALVSVFFQVIPISRIAAQLPEVLILTSGTKTSLRGLCVVNDNVVWVSGSNGTVGRTLNGGKNWTWMTVKGFEDKQFRDIEAFDANTAIIMAVDSPAYILKTTNGGESWKVVYENRTMGMFLDALDFADFNRGMVVGDPIDGHVFIATTNDNGETWKDIDTKQGLLKAQQGEAFFAASGTNLRYYRDSSFVLVSGGTRSRLFQNKDTSNLPLLQGKETTGANSIDVYDEGNFTRPGSRMIVVGGDFTAPDSTRGNCIYTTNGGKSWKTPRQPPHGYRSAVEYLSKQDLVACGMNGVDYSHNGGKHWTWISKEGFHAVRIARFGSAVYLVGEKGKVGKLSWK
jgi:photosystem II stability/assembly factor-like uncharacterized protein